MEWKRVEIQGQVYFVPHDGRRLPGLAKQRMGTIIISIAVTTTLLAELRRVTSREIYTRSNCIRLVCDALGWPSYPIIVDAITADAFLRKQVRRHCAVQST